MWMSHATRKATMASIGASRISAFSNSTARKTTTSSGWATRARIISRLFSTRIPPACPNNASKPSAEQIRKDYSFMFLPTASIGSLRSPNLSSQKAFSIRRTPLSTTMSATAMSSISETCNRLKTISASAPFSAPHRHHPLCSPARNVHRLPETLPAQSHDHL